MAKKMVEARDAEVFFVNSDDHGPADIAAANGEGKKIQWNVEKFVEITDSIYESLSKQNRTLYTVAHQQWEDWKKSPKEEPYGALDVITLHANTALNRLKVEAPKDAHPYFADVNQVNSALQAGYKFARTKESAFKAPISISGKIPEGLPQDGHYIYSGDGKPELVLMHIPMEKYKRHIEARAKIAHDRTQAADAQTKAARDEFQEKLGRDGGRYRDLKTTAETKETRERMTPVYQEGDKV
jgi:hypothetical protein